MVKGAIAKTEVADIIKAAFEDKYIGESGGKYYVWANDGGEQVQIAISLTHPKTPIGEVPISTIGGGMDFRAETVVAPVKFEPAEVSEQEQENLKQMLERLGL